MTGGRLSRTHPHVMWAQHFGTRASPKRGRGEHRGVPHALLSRTPTERMMVVLDSEYVYKK